MCVCVCVIAGSALRILVRFRIEDLHQSIPDEFHFGPVLIQVQIKLITLSKMVHRIEIWHTT